jgi:hypothetical protein
MCEYRCGCSGVSERYQVENAMVERKKAKERKVGIYAPRTRLCGLGSRFLFFLFLFLLFALLLSGE